MEPTLLHGQTILVSNIPFLFLKPKIGDIVVIKNKHPTRHSGERSDSRISSQSVKPIGRFWPSQNDGDNNKYLVKRITKVDGEKYFVSGDNKNDSLDSREFGWISKGDILGKVILKL